MADRKKIRIVMPTDWDMKQLPACRAKWEEQYEIEYREPSDHDCPWELDVPAYIESEAARPARFHGVFSSSDYPGATTSAAIAARLGLPGPDPRAVIGASHKYYSRVTQRAAAPEATAWFALVDARGPVDGGKLRYPCFIKPVKGAFSILSERLNDADDLAAFLGRSGVAEFLSSYVLMFNRLVEALTDLPIGGSFFIAEELLTGKQVTLEGFVTDGTMGRLGIVDSVRHSSTKSFVRFDYPSSLPRRIHERMWGIAEKVVDGLGLRHTLFNIELMYDSRRDRIAIVEVNPRMCGQFADLYEKVDAVNSYEVALAIAAGETPPTVTPGDGTYDVAASYPLRIFEPSRVAAAPGAAEIETASSRFAQTLIWSECAAGDALDDFESEDGKSARYAIVNLGGRDRDDLNERMVAIKSELGYCFEAIASD